MFCRPFLFFTWHLVCMSMQYSGGWESSCIGFFLLYFYCLPAPVRVLSFLRLISTPSHQIIIWVAWLELQSPVGIDTTAVNILCSFKYSNFFASISLAHCLLVSTLCPSFHSHLVVLPPVAILHAIRMKSLNTY